MQLTGTNSLIGLIALIYQYSLNEVRQGDLIATLRNVAAVTLPEPQGVRNDHLAMLHATNTSYLSLRMFAQSLKRLASSYLLRRPGGTSEEPEPDPIPNSAVKLLSADGTMSQDLGE